MQDLIRAELQRDLAGFTGRGYDKGRPKWMQALWFAVENLVFTKWWLPGFLRPQILAWFGAEVGKNTFIRHNVRVHWPWKLSIGDNCWIGEGAWLLNLERIDLAANVCVSQDAFICTGSHQHKSATFEYDNAPIRVEEGAWVAARSTVLRGSVIPSNAVVPAGSVWSRSMNPPGLTGPG
jgi:putative colanic acid biosynthesis acetyltransferase WcaF